MIMLLIIKSIYDSLIKIINSEIDGNFLSINYELVFLSSNADRIKNWELLIYKEKYWKKIESLIFIIRVEMPKS